MKSNTKLQELTRVIKSCRDTMRKDKGLNGDLDRLPMLTWIIFYKFFDDQAVAEERDREIRGERYRQIIEPPYRWRDLINGENNISDDEFIEFIGSDEAIRPDRTRGKGLFSYLRSLKGENGGERRELIATVFDDIENKMISGNLLKEVIKKVDSIDFSVAEEIHTLSHVYESMLKEISDTAGDSGEFYTPRPIVKLMVEVIDPKLGEKILDPAAGTGGFLVESFEHMKANYGGKVDDDLMQRAFIYGGEAKSLPYLLCQMNLLLHGLDYPKIDHGNSLRFKLDEITEEERVDVILTNPPFGGEEEASVLNNFPSDKRKQDTALLFLQLIMEKLKGPDFEHKGGRCGIVVPNGVLFGDGVAARIRSDLLKDFNLHTIVRLPEGVFSPYTDIKTNLVFFEKGGPTKEIWFYEVHLPEARRRYTKTNPIKFSDLKPIISWWGKRTETDKAWKVYAKELEDKNYNLDIKNPHKVVFEKSDPDIVLNKYSLLITEVETGIKNLKKNLIYTEDSRSLGKIFERSDLALVNDNYLDEIRESIMRMAFKGKLGTQKQKDTSVQSLLKRIETKKNKQIREGIIKSINVLNAIQKGEIKFEIPREWQWIRLGDIAQIVGGGTPITSNSEYFADDGIPWLTPADLYRLKGKMVERGKRDISELGLSKSSAQMIPPGSVLFSSRAPIGYVAIAKDSVTTNQGFKSCLPFIGEMNEYIYYFLKAFAKEIDNAASGTTFKEISARKMRDILIPLAPIEEQRRIVAKLDTIMKICDGIEENLKQARMLAKEFMSSTRYNLTV